MIKRVRITNYKSLGDVTVDLDPVTVLIGRSGTGKTNFVEALRLLRDFLIQRNDGIIQRQSSGWQRIMSATAHRPMTVSFFVTFTAPGNTEDYQYTLSFQQQPNAPLEGNPIFREEKLSLGKQVLFHQDQRKWIHPPAIVGAPQAGSIMLGAITGIQEVTRAHLVLTNGLGCYAFPDGVLTQPGQTPNPNVTGLSDRGENFLDALGSIIINLQTWSNLKEMVAALKTLNPSLKAIDIQLPGREKIVVSHDVSGRSLVLDVNQESEGFRRFLAHLIALYQTPPKQTLIFEEPEKGIHPAALASLADQFKACPEAGRGQVLLTTHSPQLLDHFEPEQLRVVQIENYVTKIGPIVPEQVEAVGEHLLNMGELLTVDPARLATAASAQG
jgi:predicted ATPase